MKAFIAFLLMLVCSSCIAAAGFCNWDHPGANKYQKNPVEALDDYYMDFTVRAALKAKMEHHQYDDIVEIRRDGVFGNGVYSNLRDMHYGKSSYCPGPVDTRQWPASQVERGLVYCVNEACVVVPSVCNNVSLVDRGPENGPIDISPTAGSPVGTPQPSLDQSPGESGSEPRASDHQGDASPSDYPQEPGSSWPWLLGFLVPSGGFVGPIGSPISPVPETPEWVMISAGVICFIYLWRRRDKRYD